MDEQKTKNLSLYEKLFEIQKSIKTFEVSEDADKKDSRGRTEYRYTPGWEITEAVRAEMDKHELMLIPEFLEEKSTPIEYPVYRDVGGKILTFNKKEMYVMVKMQFYFLDIVTGSTTPPVTVFGWGANGTDKSGPTALSSAERNFYQRFFHFTTREKNDEVDAHDSENIPGISNIPQGGQNYQFVPGSAPVMGAQPAPAYGGQPYGGQPAFQGGFTAQAGPTPQSGAMPPAGFDPNHPGIKAAMATLSNYNAGTPSHQRMVNQIIGNFSSQGWGCANETFIDNLVEGAQAIREGRNPNFK